MIRAWLVLLRLVASTSSIFRSHRRIRSFLGSHVTEASCTPQLGRGPVPEGKGPGSCCSRREELACRGSRRASPAKNVCHVQFCKYRTLLLRSPAGCRRKVQDSRFTSSPSIKAPPTGRQCMAPRGRTNDHERPNELSEAEMPSSWKVCLTRRLASAVDVFESSGGRTGSVRQQPTGQAALRAQSECTPL
jgi:hypothetical protein